MPVWYHAGVLHVMYVVVIMEAMLLEALIMREAVMQFLKESGSYTSYIPSWAMYHHHQV